ncbi:unnamed protein product, partial [Mesorhabditis belari]|uniref:Uncharacterized protein n=1 Tax=Mesorhabditis belari TaxID=2138241 RepID=A0AAF3EGS6_9BILA
MMPRSRLLRYISLLSFALFILYFFFPGDELPKEFLMLQEISSKSGDGHKCHLKALDPFDESIKKYVDVKPQKLKCRKIQDNYAELIDGRIHLLRNDSECLYRSVEHNSGVDDFHPRFGEWKRIEAGFSPKIFTDFVQVECFRDFLGIRKNVYRNAFFQIFPRNLSSETGKSYSRDFSTRPSVLIIGIDGVSRSNFVRQMPKTLKTMSDMNFVTLESYSKLGDNTFPNLCAMMLGKRGYFSEEFPSEVEDGWGVNYDSWTEFMWRRFGRDGYATMFSEDRPEWSTFSYKERSHGFVARPPTDHYQRPYFLSIYDTTEMLRSSTQCFGETPLHMLQLDYIESFMKTYRDLSIPFFTLFWNVELSHEYLNTLKVADDDFSAFLTRNTDLWENTVVILLSDHGNRYDAIRETVVGRMESRLPIMSIRLPELLTKKHPKMLSNLQRNAKIFTTHFDTHELLNDLLLNRYDFASNTSRGFSLLGEIPENRTCAQLNVPDSYCPCYQEVTLDVSKGKEAAEFLLAEVNREIEESPDKDRCVHMDLAKIESVSVRLPPKAIIKDRSMSYKNPTGAITVIYRISIRISPPSNALLEAVLHHDLSSKLFPTWKIDGDIERNNKYGNSSHCVETKKLQKLCHCK